MCALVDGGQTCSLPIVPPGNRECGPPRPAIGQGGRGRLRRWSSCNHRVCATLPCCAQMLLRVMVDERIGDAVASDLREVDLRIHASLGFGVGDHLFSACHLRRSEEHTSELQSLMRISYAGFCLQKKNDTRMCSGVEYTLENE